MGFKHHIVTPEYARANGEAESFMKMLNKTEKIAKLQGQDSKQAVTEMLMGYRGTPHPATKCAPYKVMMNRDVKTKLDTNPETETTDELQDEISEQDLKYKSKLGIQTNSKRNVKEHTFVIGDYVVLKQKKQNKFSTAYEPSFYVIYKINGCTYTPEEITVEERLAENFKTQMSLPRTCKRKRKIRKKIGEKKYCVSVEMFMKNHHEMKYQKHRRHRCYQRQHRQHHREQ